MCETFPFFQTHLLLILQGEDDDTEEQMEENLSEGEEAEQPTDRGSGSDTTHSGACSINVACPSTSCDITRKRKKPDKQKKNVGEILTRLLVQNRETDREMGAKVC